MSAEKTPHVDCMALKDAVQSALRRKTRGQSPDELGRTLEVIAAEGSFATLWRAIQQPKQGAPRRRRVS